MQWAEKKKLSISVSERIRGLNEESLEARYVRMAHCSDVIITKRCPECGHLHVIGTSLCRDRLCPICSTLRARAVARRVGLALSSSLLAPYGFVFLTLTVKNCAWEDLETQLEALAAGWKRFRELKHIRKAFCGSIRTVEITKGRDGLAHPHLHVLFSAPKNYFLSPSLYLSQARVCEMWQQAMRLDYLPVCDIRSAVKRDKIPFEIVKYITKTSDLASLSDGELLHFIRAIHGRRMFSLSGIMRLALADLEPDDLSDEELLLLESDNLISCVKCGGQLVETVFKWNYTSFQYEVLLE